VDGAFRMQRKNTLKSSRSGMRNRRYVCNVCHSIVWEENELSDDKDALLDRTFSYAVYVDLHSMQEELDMPWHRFQIQNMHRH
jgi:hypothetical protein